MKKIKVITGIIAVVLIAAMAGFNVSINKQGNKLSAISLANIEALAQGENDNNNTTWQVGEKTIVSTTSPGWSWSISANLWMFNGQVTYNNPPDVTTIKIKCCRQQGDLASCSYEGCKKKTGIQSPKSEIV
jgi:hypothetical protein